MTSHLQWQLRQSKNHPRNTAERAFSGLNQLKTYSRCSMGGDRLGGLSLMLVHCDIPINVNTIIDTFAAKYQTRMAMVNILADLSPLLVAINRWKPPSMSVLCLQCFSWSFPKHRSTHSYYYIISINSSFTDFPLIKLPSETDFFFKEDPWSSPWAQYRL